MYGYFRQYWKDPRLAGKLNRTLTLHGGDIDKLWTPDPFCYNARESNMMLPNAETHSFAHIRPNGDLELSKRWARSNLVITPSLEFILTNSGFRLNLNSGNLWNSGHLWNSE